MIWNDQLKREIPEGWGVASLVSNPLVEPLKPGVAPFVAKTYLATADVVGTTIKNGSVICYETREGRANMEPVLNSVWFAKMKGSVKHLFLNEVCDSLIDETILSTGFVGLRCEPVAFEYISSFVASEEFELLKDLHAHGATQQAVNNTDLENILICVPEDETLKRFKQVTSPILSRFNASIIENKRLQDLRDWLLPMLMNGQATVASSDKLSFTGRISMAPGTVRKCFCAISIKQLSMPPQPSKTARTHPDEPGFPRIPRSIRPILSLMPRKLKSTLYQNQSATGRPRAA